MQQDRRRKFLEILEKRAKKRQKLLSMKRYSSLLKRPEILETVYSVESEDGNEGGKAEAEKKEEVTKEEEDVEDDTSKETSSNKARLVQMKRMESETTSYDWSTDSESLRYTAITLSKISPPLPHIRM